MPFFADDVKFAHVFVHVNQAHNDNYTSILVAQRFFNSLMVKISHDYK